MVCKWRKKKNRGLEIEIRGRTRKNIEAKQEQDEKQPEEIAGEVN